MKLLHQIAAMKELLTVEQEQAILDDLPHGSGIDCTWRVERRNETVRFTNAFHLMDENGYYCGYQDFYIRVYRCPSDVIHPLKGPLSGKAQVLHRKGDLEWTLHFSGGEHYHARKTDLKSYLHEVFYDTMKKFGLMSPERELIDV